jgi:colanic acid biosynthesis glycosyl transferase WcaI
MRIVVWGINYSPELTGIGPCNTALCEHLVQQGHEVEMVTSFAYYPEWRKKPEDAGTLFRTDTLKGVRVHRCWHYVPQAVRTWKRIVHELSFVTVSTLRCLSLKRPDALVVVSPPLLLGPAAWLVGALKACPFLFHVQDLQPDAALGLGMIRPGTVVRLLYWVESLAYRKAARVSGISQGMLAAFAEKGVPEEKTVYFPNGVVLDRLELPQSRDRFEERVAAPGRLFHKGDPASAGIPLSEKLPDASSPQSFRSRHGFACDDFLAVYSGNLGAKQGLSTLVDAAPLLRNPKVKIVICGQGAQRETLVAQAQGKPIVFLPLLSEPEYRQMMAETDVCLITQMAGTGRFFFPSKLLPSLAQSKPILSVADEESELARAVKEAGCGLNVLPGNSAAIAEALDFLATQCSELEAMGRRGRDYVQRFELKKVLADFEKALVNLQRKTE